MITEVYPNPHLIQKCDTDSSTTSSRLVKASRFYWFAHVAQTLNSRSVVVWQHVARWLKQTADLQSKAQLDASGYVVAL